MDNKSPKDRFFLPSEMAELLTLPSSQKRGWSSARIQVLGHLLTKGWSSKWMFAKIVGFSPQIIHLFIGVSIIFTIHFGVFPLFLETLVGPWGLSIPVEIFQRL